MKNILGILSLAVGLLLMFGLSSVLVEPSPMFLCLLYPVMWIGTKIR